MATTIPKQYYVTIQYRKDSSTTSGLLGFASPYTKDAAFEKRRSTQESWAYGGYGTSFEIREDDSIIPTKDCKIDKFALFATKCYPIIINNEPLNGFEIAKSVRRYGWGGGGNVVWRLADPRGFELEISSDNFARIIDCCTLINGVIQEKCVWGREGAKNLLLPVTSEPYQEAFAHTALVNTKISFKDVKLGDHVTLIDKSQQSGHRDGIYMGRMFAVESQDSAEHNDRYNYSPVQNLKAKVVDKYVFREINSDEMFAITKPVVGAMVSKALVEGVLAYNIQEANNLLSLGKAISGFPANTVLIIQKASDLKDVKTELVDATVTMVDDKFAVFDKKSNYYHTTELLLVTKDDKNWYLTSNAIPSANGHVSYDNSIAVLYGIDYDKLLTGELHVKSKSQPIKNNGSYWNYSSYTEVIATDKLTSFDIKEFKAKSLWLTQGELKARVAGVPGYTAGFVRKY